MEDCSGGFFDKRHSQFLKDGGAMLWRFMLNFRLSVMVFHPPLITLAALLELVELEQTN